MLPRARETTKWAWDDVPVQSMRAAKWMPSWWNALESELMTADTSSVYADHHTLQEEEREAIHRCALLYHARRMKTAKEAELRSVGLRRSHHAHSEAKDANLSGVLLTPRYQGRAPGTGFMVRQYLQSTEDVHRVAFQQPLGLQQRRSAQLRR
ncbi:Hypothetical protein, putative [Bodo saltans]|uniref:Uncharacterized protein n=1 Tax=Bodo saltans TaxID=75058 RepID=A0A0S4J4P9_BODSA|nr:Hypothetical protein, putative [Bodo saltans]|eukprot:CUG78649.1 Hypothetical protein, putative [Bodo saltans]